MRSRRISRCSTCGLNGLLCVCAALPRLAANVRVVVVAHRTELLKSTNTGRLAVRMLEGAEILCRAVRVEGDAAPAALNMESPDSTYVLFPSDDALPLEEASARGLSTLIVPDGTWGQAKRMARRDPSCVGLRHVRLDASLQSHYFLRRNTRPDGLCTFEAVAEALRGLGNEKVAGVMLEAFAHWVTCATLVRAGAHDSQAARLLASVSPRECHEP